MSLSRFKIVNGSKVPSATESNDTSGGDDGGNNMEIRIARVEASVSHIESDIKEIKIDLRELRKDSREDFRILFGALILTALGIAGIVAKGFHWF